MDAPLTSSDLTGIRVSGNQLVDGNGNAIHLQGVNRSGTEYACVQVWGIFDGPSDAASVKAIASWHVNIVRPVRLGLAG
jgi:endoglucanase